MSKKGNGSDSNNLLFCSFCGKNQNEVRKLIAGPSVYICDECVDLCNDIIKEELSTTLGLVGLNDINDISSEIIAEKFFKNMKY